MSKTSYTIKIKSNAAIKDRCLRFAYAKYGKSLDLYKSRQHAELNDDKAIANEYIGKLAEAACYWLLTNIYPNSTVTQPDYTIYPNSQATNNPDIMVDDIRWHVKCCRASSWEQSWLYSKHHKHNPADYHCLCTLYIDSIKIRIYKDSELVFDLPRDQGLQQTRKAVYLEQL